MSAGMGTRQEEYAPQLFFVNSEVKTASFVFYVSDLSSGRFYDLHIMSKWAKDQAILFRKNHRSIVKLSVSPLLRPLLIYRIFMGNCQ